MRIALGDEDRGAWLLVSGQGAERADLAPWPRRTPLNPIVGEVRRHDGYTVQNVVLEVKTALDGVITNHSLIEQSTLSRIAQGEALRTLGVEKELVLTPLMHDTPGELGQAFEVKDWKKGECELIPGKTAPQMTVVERDYPNVYKRFTALGPLMGKVGNGGKGIAWNTQDEVRQLGELNGLTTAEGATRGMPKIDSAMTSPSRTGSPKYFLNRSLSAIAYWIRW